MKKAEEATSIAKTAESLAIKAQSEAESQRQVAQKSLEEIERQRAAGSAVAECVDLLALAQSEVAATPRSSFQNYTKLLETLRANTLARSPAADIAIRTAFAELAASDESPDEDYGDSIELLKGALATAESSFGRGHPASMRVRGLLADRYLDDDNVEAARATYADQLELLRASGGGGDVATLRVMFNLARTSQNLGQEDGTRLFSEATSLARRLAPSSDTVATPEYLSYAKQQASKKDYGTASEYFAELWDISKRLPADEWPLAAQILQESLSYHSERGDDAACRKLWTTRIDILGPHAHETSSDVQTLLVNSADACENLGLHGEAERAWRFILDARLKVLEPVHWRVGNAQSRLGGSLLLQGRLAEAEPLLLQGYAALRHSPDTPRSGDENRELQGCQRLVKLYEAWAANGTRSDDLLKWRTELAAVIAEEAQRKTQVDDRIAASELREQAWAVLQTRTTVARAGPEKVKSAIQDALKAAENAQDVPWIVHTSGVALWRNQHFEQALAAFQKSDNLYVKDRMGPQSANWVFIAMSEWKLGRTDAARASRAKFEELLLKDGKTDTPQIADWRAEMEEVFLSK